jgi:hypothetical protein
MYTQTMGKESNEVLPHRDASESAPDALERQGAVVGLKLEPTSSFAFLECFWHFASRPMANFYISTPPLDSSTN